MKKIGVICIALIFAVSNIFAQESQEKKKENLFPHAGDFAIGMDLANFVKSINNSITNDNSANSVVAFQSDFFGKYFLTDHNALRLRLGVGINNFTEREFVRDDAANLLNPVLDNPITMKKTVDVWNSRNTMLELGFGYEHRRNLWRVQGYIGGEIFGGVNLQRDFFEYGNPMTETNQKPTTAFALNPVGTGSYRALDTKAFGFNAGAAAFVGADLFLCKNLSVGVEFSFEGRYTHWGETTAKTETWLFDQAYTAEEMIKPVSSAFNLNPMGRLNLMIYF